MKSHMSIKQIFTWLGVTVAILMGLIVLTSYSLNSSYQELRRAEQSRYQSYLLADELRQSSDDLTRLARTFVVSGDSRYEKQYFEILDIRNGKKPRPQNYERIYWDFVAATDQAPRPPGEAVPLLDLMSKAGFSKEELGKLEEAKANSDALVKTETIAMNAVNAAKATKKDGDSDKSDTSANAQPTVQQAATMMHDRDYHINKAKIMKPVDEFLSLLDKRTAETAETAAAQAHNREHLIYALLAISFTVLVVALTLAYRLLQQQLGGEPVTAAELAEKIAAGDLSTRIELKSGDTQSLMVSMKKMSAAIQALAADANVLSTSARQGQLESRADVARHQGEFRTIIDGINNTMTAVAEPINDVKRVMAAIEQGDFTRTIDADYQGDFGELQASVNNTLAKLSETISQVTVAAGELTNASTQVSATSQGLSQASAGQASSLEETTAAIEEMAASIAQNTDNAKTTDGIARKSAEDALAGGEAVKSTVVAMKSIADKISIIDDIAYRT
ncbi:MAG TPA: HAMP domain-containing protein, partial [Rhodocyclaceae bacterium]|nr:HAMP domain-containing protein [Rhodocyclaceae bacterium]